MFAAGGAEGGGRRPHRRPHKDALREFHEFSKKMKMDTGLTIKTIAGGDIVELDDLLSDADGSESESSDGFSDFEREFAVDPEAALQPDQGDESYIDPETGDFVEPGRPPSRPSTPLAAPRTPLAGLDLSKDVRPEDILDGEGLAAAEDAKLDEPGEADGPRDAPPPSEPEPDEPEAQKAEDDKMKGGSATLNVRRNIREVMDENQLDASTLAAQRQESERLARVQEQQRIIREVRRQIALGRQDKAQARVLSLLQGRTGSSVLKKPMPIDPTGLAGQKLNIPGTVLMKLPSGETKRVPKPSHHDLAKMHRTKCNLTPSVSIAPVGSPMRHDIAKISPAYKKEVVEIVDSSSTSSSSESGPSSDSDDCIMLSDSELPPSPEPDEDPQNSGLHVNDTYNVPDEQGRVVINIGHPENEEDIFLAPQIGRIIKPHQIGGVRFLFDNIIESVERFSNSTGFGCILAHSMGLGKTLQIVCFCDIFLRHTSSKTVLCIMPINTLQNWVAEFNMWLPLDASVSPLSSHGEVRSRNFPIYVLNDSHKTLQARAKVIKEWNELGGVLMIGYELYRLLSLKKNKKPRNRKKKSDSQIKQNENKDKSDNSRDIDEKQNETNKLNLGDNKKVEGIDYSVPLNPLDEMKPRENNLDFNGDKSKDGDFKDFLVDKKEEEEDTDEEKKLLDEIYYALVKPGPDLVICDEGHRIKNSHSNISYALKQMRTKRRIVLTGYPLQNNLLEYWCMVDFVRPNYLGTKTEFSNMFERPIQNGQCIDSTPQDIRLMRYRAHVLHSLLVGFVQRRSHAVLQSTLPQKEEYVLLVRMTELQRKLYDVFMNEVVRKRTVPNPLKAFAVCCKIWNHPDVLYSFLKKRNETAAVVDFDLEIEDNPTLPATNQPVANKKGRKSKATPRKREKAPPKSAKNGKPAATIPPNTSNNTNATEKSELPKIENSNVELNVNPNPTYTPIENNEIKPPFEQPVSNQTNNYPSYQDFQQYPHGNYYGQNEPYDASYGTGYYQNQSYNNDYNNYNTQNSQAPPENSILPPQQNVPRYPENSDFNSQSYWNSDNNYYNNSNSNYYPEQPAPQPPQQQPQPQPEYQSSQDPYSAIFDPFTQQDQPYQFNENRSYDSNIPNGEHPQQTFSNILESTNTFTPSSSTETTRPFDQTIATSGTDSNNFNNSIYPAFQGTQDISLESDSKSSLHDEISTLCWPVGTEDNIKQEDMESSNTSQADPKQEAKADSDTEIKIADLDTMKVIVNDKPRIKMEDVKSENKDNLDVVKTEADMKQNIKTDVPLTDDILKKEDKGKSKAKPKTERKPREKKPKEPKEPKEKKSKVTKEIKDKAKNKEKDKPEKDITDVDSDIEGEKIDSVIDKMKYEKSEEVPYDWATELLKSYIPGIIENSGKMEIFFCVLEESVRLGDRILLFSQSLFTLSLIEDFLQKNIIPGTDQCWMKNKSYYRLDGSTSALEREKLINEFNSNPNIHLFLVSTRAGSLGINLVGANRVVVFDASWNPCHDTQAVCRVYRYGQKKPCFVYRLVMDWCLEKKIYDRQINKQGMADRVVDECNPDAVLSMKEVTNLCWDNDEKEINFKELDKDCKDKYIDVIMRKIMEEHTKTLSKEPFQHESLLVDRKEKKLSSAEKRLAQRGYELEKKAASNPKPSLMYRTIRTADGTLIQRPVASVRPMQHGGSSSGGTRWIPADVWQRQGMTAQEMTLPLDVVIPTNSAEKSNIVLKAGQKVMVLKSPKGIYMQLESGKIIAIKTSFKVGQKNAEQKEIPKKILPSRPPNVNLPGSLKNNSAITVISKSARGNMSKMIARPSVLPKKLGTPIRPMMSGPRIIDQKIRPIHSNLQVRPYSLIRGRAPLYRGSRPIPIQNHLNIKIQGSSIRGPGMNMDYKDYSREIERMPSEQDFDVNMESIDHSDFNQPNEPGSSMYKVENDNFENSPSKSLDQQADSSDNYEEDGVSRPLEPTLPEDIASEDSSQERTYVDLSDKSDTKITTKPINKKSPSSKPATSANLFKDCNIQIKNTLLPSSPLDLGFVNNVTIKRTSAPGSALPSSILTNSSPMKERSLGPVHILPEEACLSEGIMSDYKLPPSQNSIPDDNYMDNSVTIKEKKIYKPNLVDRKTKTSSLKNYRHQKFIQKPIPIQSVDFALGKVSPASTSSSPTPPPASVYNSLNQSSSKSSQDKYESSLSQLEKTTSLINRSPKKGGMSDFQQSLSDITRTYSPNSENSSIEPPPYKPGPKSRKKKNPSQTELRGSDSSEAVNAILEKIPNKNIASGVDISLSQSISPDNSVPSSQLGNFSQNSYNNAPESAANPGGFAEPGYQQTAPGNSESLPQQPYNSYPGYPPAGGSYPPYPPASYYQPYPPAHYPGYPQYPAAPAYPPGPYPPSPYPGYPPYPNPNTHQW